MSLNERVAQQLGDQSLKIIQLEEKLAISSAELTNLREEHTALQANFDNLNTTSAMLLRKSNQDNEALKTEVRELRALLDLQTSPALDNVSVNDSVNVHTDNQTPTEDKQNG